jgi:hypothetical protein
MPEGLMTDLLSGSMARFVLEQTELMGVTLEVWRDLRGNPPSDVQLSRFVELGLQVYQRMQSLYSEAYRRVVKDQAVNVADAQRERRLLGAVYRAGAEWSWRFWEVLRDIRLMTGRQVEGTDRLLEAATQFRDLQSRLVKEWPVCSPEEEQQALAQVGGGEGMELDDAFAQIAGVDKTAWLERVAEHKRKHHQTGQE